MKKSFKNLTVATALTLTLTPALGFADEDWEFAVGIYGFLPDITGTSNLSEDGQQDFEIDLDTILDNLEFTLQGNFDARHGRVGIFSDVIYLDMRNSQAIAGGGGNSGAAFGDGGQIDVNLKIKNLIWTTSAYYRLIDESDNSLDLMFGVRYADMKQTLSWNADDGVDPDPFPTPSGSAEVGASYLDGIVGLRGHAALGDGGWFLPYYADIGTGDSDLTWQAAAGIGYTFGWGEMTAGWRYLSYDLPSGTPIEDLALNGPQIGAMLRW